MTIGSAPSPTAAPDSFPVAYMTALKLQDLSIPAARCPVAVALLLLGAGTLALAGASSRQAVWLEREAYLMGTGLRLSIAAPSREAAIAASEMAFAEMNRLEGLLSSWRDESELSGLNRALPGSEVQLSAELSGILLELEPWIEATGGAFHPAGGALIDAWDLRGEGRIPTDAELRRALAQSGAGAIHIEDGRAVRLHDGSWITAGAFGKGAALRAARRVLLGAGIESALLDFGGQLLALGPARDGGDWVVGIAHPSSRHREVAGLVLGERSAATSAASERFVEVSGERLGHIIDPRNGQPVQAWGSVTVVAEDPLVADLLSTALFVMGPEEGMAWTRAHPEIAVLFLELTADGLKRRWTRAMDPWLRNTGEAR